MSCRVCRVYIINSSYYQPTLLYKPHRAYPPLLALLVVSGLLFSPFLVCSSGYSFFARLPTTNSYTPVHPAAILVRRTIVYDEHPVEATGSFSSKLPTQKEHSSPKIAH